MTGSSNDTSPFRPNVMILGVYLDSPAYPNAKFVIEGLRNSDAVHIVEVNMPMVTAPASFGLPRGRLAGLARSLRAAYSHANVFLRFLFRKRPDVVYVPYPAIGVLMLLSLLPRRLRPGRIVADAFISVYNTAVTDRRLLSGDSWRARLLRLIERRAYRTANVTTVDTPENRDYYADLFDLPTSKFAVVPLATDEAEFQASEYVAQGERCHVVFVGTFVPLQGTDVIARAILELRGQKNISFTIVGAGQAAADFAGILGDEQIKKLEWIREWQDSRSVAAHIRSADLCLGIFSDGSKAQRVWPFKNYAYMSCGRAIVTADTACARRMLEENGDPAFATVAPGDSAALADAIRRLATDPSFRERLARSARRYYDSYLANSVAIDRLVSGPLTGQQTETESPRGTVRI